ncbi:MAG: hypothetical protein Q9P01_05685 [Anaerolineae bacterium]|nr:hypothetical protein [Anaerolineae bacterium]
MFLIFGTVDNVRYGNGTRCRFLPSRHRYTSATGLYGLLALERPDSVGYLGPNCLNPVMWDLNGFQRIGTWVFFTRPDGSTDGGVLVGFTWQLFRGSLSLSCL